MINNSSIMKKVEQYAKSKAGKAKMEEVIQDHRKSGKKLASGEKLTSEQDMLHLADVMIEIVKKHLPESIEAVGDGMFHSGIFLHATGDAPKIGIFFNKADLSRPSVDPQDGVHHWDGVDNIVAVLNNGVHAKDYAYGWWEGHASTGSVAMRSFNSDHDAFIRTTKDRPALLFMQDAIREFNTKYRKKYHVMAVCGTDYAKGMAEQTVLES